ncbi:uncharacterized protein LOC125224563 [Salvia hispanica]|uniref:uncharacterized protein LOC125224563 n=1 Tax=Salvia hispanica TaxID=49212 RepID=UPI002009040B|nr:uncharacterized protein LOC125224563 [Salvia hispanica]
MLLSPLPSAADPPRLSHDIDSSCSTPFVSAPSSPAHAPPSGYFHSAPASPMHFKIKSLQPDYDAPVFLTSDSASFEFEFSSRFSPTGLGSGSMTSADELFFNGQIRPMRQSSHFPRPVLDLCGGDLKVREAAKYSHRKARSMSPLRTEWHGFSCGDTAGVRESEAKEINESAETTPSCSASSSRSSSSSGRNSKKWIFLKDLLHRSMSEGRANNKEKFWSSISFSPAKEERKKATAEKKGRVETKREAKAPAVGKPANGVWRRPSAHELHYTANRAQAEEMKKKTFLPYRQGLFGCLGFSSKSYGAFTEFTRKLNPFSSG